MFRIPVLLLPLLASLTACAPSRVAAPAIVNPVIDADFPDPAVLKASDGFYYAYATQSGDHNVQVARSADLARWDMLGDALPAKPSWASHTQDFWAPHVHAADGRYYLYYSAKPDAALTDSSKGLCLAVATADRPQGPFTDVGRPLECGAGFVNIDPMAFDDPATGKRLLYWGSGFGAIKVLELAPDRTSFVGGAAPIDLIHPATSNNAAGYERLIEGAWVTQHDGYYYLFYSGDNCCGPNAHYATMVARSRHATGPFETLAQGTGASSSVMLERTSRWIAPGHNSIVQDESGRHWIVYHAVDARRPRTRSTDEVNSRRVMLIAPVAWKNGWPHVGAP